MKSLFKVTLLATTMAVALNAPLTFAADTATKAALAAESKSAFKNDDQKSAYALGASPGALHGKLPGKNKRSWALSWINPS